MAANSGGLLRVFLLANLTFLWTGVSQNLQAYYMDIAGVTLKTQNGIAASGNVVGSLLLLGFWPSLRRAVGREHFRQLWWVSLFDLGGAVFSQVCPPPAVRRTRALHPLQRPFDLASPLRPLCDPPRCD